MKECAFCGCKNLEDAKVCVNCRSKFIGKISYQIDKPNKFAYYIFLILAILCLSIAIYLSSIFIFSILPDFSFEPEVIFGTLIFGIVMIGISYILIRLAYILFLMAKTNNE